MNKEQLEQIIDMCQHPGWKLLLEDAEVRMEALRNGVLLTAENFEEVVGNRAEYFVLSRLARTEETVKEALQQLEEAEAEGESEDEDF